MDIKINSSDAAAAIYPNKYKTVNDVIRAKVRNYFNAEDESDSNIAMDYSSSNISAAIFDFELETGIDVLSCDSKSNNEVVCKPHGLIDDDTILMVRIPYSSKDSGEFDGIQSQSNLYAKAQIQMCVFNASSCIFYQWSSISTKIETIEYSHDFISNYYGDIQQIIEDIKDSIKDPEKHLCKIIKTKQAVSIVSRMGKTISDIKRLNRELELIKKDIIDMAGGDTVNVAGVLVKDGDIFL